MDMWVEIQIRSQKGKPSPTHAQVYVLTSTRVTACCTGRAQDTLAHRCILLLDLQLKVLHVLLPRPFPWSPLSKVSGQHFPKSLTKLD